MDLECARCERNNVKEECPVLAEDYSEPCEHYRGPERTNERNVDVVKRTLRGILADLDGKRDSWYLGKYNGIEIALKLLEDVQSSGGSVQ